MKRKPAIALALSLLFTFNMNYVPAQACSFGTAPYFVYSTHPDMPLKKFAAGQLGILESTYARSYLLAAHRYLSGAPLSKEEQEGIVALWDERINASDYSCNPNTAEWIKLRATIPGASKVSEIDTERSVGKDSYEFYCNAQSSSFATAVDSLKKMIAKYSVGSKEVKEWLDAQDKVFSNCGSPRYSEKAPPVAIPEALPAGSDPYLMKERNYQIAAANFYAQNFDQARKDFEAIAVDQDSRWNKTSGYLAVRAMIRKATLADKLDLTLLKEAGDRIKVLHADSSYSAFKEDLTDLANFIAARVEPAEHLKRLVKEKIDKQNVNEITKTLDRILEPGGDESVEVSYEKAPKDLKEIEVVDWILDFQSSDDASSAHAVERWKNTHSTPWLVAAIMGADSESPALKELVAAARAEKSKEAQWTLFYHANRLDIDSGKGDAVRTILDKMLSTPPTDIPAGALNKLKLQRLPLSRNLDELVKFGVQAPLAVCSNGGTAEIPDEAQKIEETGKPEVTTPQFTAELADVLANRLPVSMLRQIAANPKLPKDLKNNLAWTSWVRAVLIGDEAEAKLLGPIVKSLKPARAKFIDAYLSAATPEARKFAAVFLMLKYSSAEPNVTWGPLNDDEYGDGSGWWWSDAPILKVEEPYDSETPIEKFDPAFLTAAQKAQVTQQLAKLKKVEAAPNYFAHVVLAYAKAHPADPRVPEALHLGVKATRYGVTNDATKVLSKQMYQVLHSKYKANVWTKQTPYYY